MIQNDQNIEQEIAADERWLAGFATQLPTAAAVKRVREAVHSELHRSHSPAMVRLKAWHGAVAAAAMIAMAVGVAWQSARDYALPADVSSHSAALIALADEQQVEVTQLAAIDKELSRLEAWSKESPSELSGRALYSAFNEALSDDSERAKDSSGSM